MITVYSAAAGRLEPCADSAAIPAGSVWIDMLNPTEDEDKRVEAALGIDIPTRSEMREIEASNRLYTENGSVYMTAVVLHSTDKEVPTTSPITFILAGEKLVTVRYAEPRAFPVYVARACKADAGCGDGTGIFLGLIETLIEREADLIERVQDEVERTAPIVFGQKSARDAVRNRRLDVLLRSVGREGDMTARAQESASSINRLLLYAASALRERGGDARHLKRLEIASNDISSLMENLRFLSNRTSFLLEATLGMISNEQNQIIKLFSVMAVMLMPPTLVASIYGMNFDHMPEIHWTYGYPLALLAMVVSGLIPFFYFRHRGWF